ncbi:hypothetical protein SESBI_49855 [Sesbania bispinosa]|nr:hypothetical protein SESBI_49855 [Sesbania bispinosa]
MEETVKTSKSLSSEEADILARSKKKAKMGDGEGILGLEGGLESGMLKSQETFVAESQLEEGVAGQGTPIFPTSTGLAMQRKIVSYKDAILGENGESEEGPEDSDNDDDEEEFFSEDSVDGGIEKDEPEEEIDPRCPTVRVSSRKFQEAYQQKDGDVAVQNIAEQQNDRDPGTEFDAGVGGNFGPWNIVQKQTRRRQQQGKKVSEDTSKVVRGAKNDTPNHGVGPGSRFNVLAQMVNEEGNNSGEGDPMVVVMESPEVDPNSPNRQISPASKANLKTVTQIRSAASKPSQELGQSQVEFSAPRPGLEHPVLARVEQNLESCAGTVAQNEISGKEVTHTPSNPPILKGSGLVVSNWRPPDKSHTSSMDNQPVVVMDVVESSSDQVVGPRPMED